jgi:hypothetical protein
MTRQKNPSLLFSFSKANMNEKSAKDIHAQNKRYRNFQRYST